VNIEDQIRVKIESLIQPSYMNLINESFKHNVPENSETHFNLTAVSEYFNGLSKVARHQQVYKVLEDELAGPIHALSLHLFTPEEWSSEPASLETPDCAGGEREN